MARLTLALMTYNALKIFRMKWENRYQEVKRIMKARRRVSFLQGDHQIIAYYDDRFATFTAPEFFGLAYAGGRGIGQKEGAINLLQKVFPLFERAPPDLKNEFDQIKKEVIEKP